MRAGDYMRFPASGFRSLEEFQRFREENGERLNERRRQEGEFCARVGAITIEGTCGFCLRVTRFASRVVGDAPPDWRAQQRCGCGCDLNSYQRAMLHFAAPRLGRAGWYRAAVFGRDDEVVSALSKILPDLTLWPRLEASGPEGHTLPAETGSTHMVLSADYLALVPPLDAAFAEIARVLSPGGLFIFTVPFDLDAETTTSAMDHLPVPNRPPVSTAPVHHFGWDMLERVRGAGFRDCVAHCYWSLELGYLGSQNMIFMAFR